ncbi:MAG TPA: sugar transferase [Limnobacter sp.]|nr:sugar transferase [Limnobacter sp.]
MKRLFDIVLSAIALLLLSPVMLTIALLVFWQDGGSPLFLQTRVGRGCKPFQIYKFRTMVKDAHLKGQYFTVDNDPRITRLGKFLRKSSLDELPQLLNILFGHMSIVGPRPDVPAQQKLYQPHEWQKRHTVRPGLTGLAQVRRRLESGHAPRLALDLEYVDNHSFLGDLAIIVQTAWQVISKGGN